MEQNRGMRDHTDDDEHPSSPCDWPADSRWVEHGQVSIDPRISDDEDDGSL